MSEEYAVVLAHQNDAMPMSAATIRAHVNLIAEVQKSVMQEGTHYGVTPGCGDKPSLYKPGAEKLCVTFRIAPRYFIEDLSTADSVRYRIRCEGRHQGTDVFLGEGLGECSSMEDKYKWRKAVNTAEFEATPEDRKRIKYANGKNGSSYVITQIRTQPADIANTVLKMAAKRAQVAMTLNVTGASDIFTQDVEDLPDELKGSVEGNDGTQQQKTEVRQPKPKSETRSAPPPVEGAGEALPDDAPATESMRKIVAAKMEAAALSGIDMKVKFGFDLAGLPAARVNDVIAWTKDPVGAAA